MNENNKEETKSCKKDKILNILLDKKTVFGVITGLFDVFIGIFTGNWSQAWTGVKEIFTSIFDYMKNTFVNIFNTMALFFL